MDRNSELWRNYKQVYFFTNKDLLFHSFAVITAWNPGSRWVSKEENSRANAHLSHNFNDFNYCKLMVGDLKRTWLEESFAVEMPQNLAIELGKKYNQNAIYYVNNNQLYLISCINPTISEMIGNLSQKVVIQEQNPGGKTKNGI